MSQMDDENHWIDDDGSGGVTVRRCRRGRAPGGELARTRSALLTAQRGPDVGLDARSVVAGEGGDEVVVGVGAAAPLNDRLGQPGQQAGPGAALGGRGVRGGAQQLLQTVVLG